MKAICGIGEFMCLWAAWAVGRHVDESMSLAVYLGVLVLFFFMKMTGEFCND